MVFTAPAIDDLPDGLVWIMMFAATISTGVNMVPQAAGAGTKEPESSHSSKGGHRV